MTVRIVEERITKGVVFSPNVLYSKGHDLLLFILRKAKRKSIYPS